jgi:hypothetical protein
VMKVLISISRLLKLVHRSISPLNGNTVRGYQWPISELLRA